ncbi:hypothetical protein EPUS_02634 [Endocarpon pusillum Z07020]|uniref:DNA helicase n=1 Tax=Endocarpon pusillum (strain Z07020 / HMAS-L-300199) TaxID=1263415 RepID=U1GGW6_ENDPU|nr:uncharacterized protein EPUS_02634 [Endocarpon pusillum Z07020]ERF76922.1 hypothetical protein EPUS_02634 [Endocarpon pusillum Z07020]
MPIKPAKLSPAAFAQAQLSLLNTEQSAEVAETTLLLSEASPTALARAGLAILNLNPVSQRTGLGGKTILELGLDPAVASAERGGSDLPEHGIRTGDIVRLGEQPGGGAKKKEKAEMKGNGVEGVVTRVGERAVWVALGKGSGGDEDVDIPSGKLWLVKVANDVTYKRTSEAAVIVQDVRKEMDDKQASIKKTRNGRERRAIYADLKGLRKEYREREGKCVNDLLTASRVVLATLHGAGGFQLRTQQFDVVVIDEASQALEAQCWIPLLSARKAVLAGDHLQLPPTVKSLNIKTKSVAKTVGTALDERLQGLGLNDQDKETARSMRLETTMFDRLLSLHGPSIKTLLTTQYRMNEKIMRFPSNELYEAKLVAADSVKERLLKDLPYEVQDTEDTREPLVFYDTQGGDFPERMEDHLVAERSTMLGDSKSNEMEAAVVQMHVGNLIDAGVRAEDIAVITPYNAQLASLSSLLKERYPGIELGSVDGFQGREKEAVIVSLVRSNPEKEVGFLGEKRRLNGEHMVCEHFAMIDNPFSGNDQTKKTSLRNRRFRDCQPVSKANISVDAEALADHGLRMLSQW